jgi:CheY-like chemotaxis protein
MSKVFKILLIEDDEDDIELLEEALKENKVPYSLDVVMEGDKVTHYFNTVKTLPQVIVLDFNLPKLHGREILHIIKSTHHLKDVPVVVLTTSAAKEDAEYALRLGAKHFITKPTSMKDFSKTVELIKQSASVSDPFEKKL